MAASFQHINGDAKEDKAAGDLKGRDGNTEKLQDEASHRDHQDQDQESIEAGLPGQAPGGCGRMGRRESQIRKDVAYRVSDDEQGDQAGNEKGPDRTYKILFHNL